MERALLWILVVVAGCFQAVTSLECYKCSTYKSMEECTRSQTKTRCLASMTRCYNMTVQVHLSLLGNNVTVFQRGCSEELNCDNEKCPRHFGKAVGAEKENYKSCQVNCCEGDLCPEGNVTKAEVIGPDKGARGGSPSVYATRVFLALIFFLSSIGCFSFNC